MGTFWVILVVVLAAALIYYYPSEKKEKEISVLYGYPAGRTTWLTVYHRRSTDEWIFEWDDLFDEGRPKSWGDIRQCQMYPDHDKGATQEEIAKAREMIRKRFG